MQSFTYKIGDDVNVPSKYLLITRENKNIPSNHFLNLVQTTIYTGKYILAPFQIEVIR
jgi:hypothetical protein